MAGKLSKYIRVIKRRKRGGRKEGRRKEGRNEGKKTFLWVSWSAETLRSLLFILSERQNSTDSDKRDIR